MKTKLVTVLLFILLFATPAWANETMRQQMLHPFVRVNGASGVVVRSWQHKPDEFWCYVLTGWHVVEGVVNPKAIPADFIQFDDFGLEVSANRLIGRVVEKSLALDYAIISYKTKALYPVASCVKPTDALNLGLFDTVYVVGAPNRQRVWVAQGIVSSLQPNKMPGFIGHSATVYYGSSGGPLFNENYELIGLNLRIGIDSRDNTPLPTQAFSLPLFNVYRDLGVEKTKKYFGH